MTSYNIKIRLIRPLIHFLIIIAVFYTTYRIRLVTDLIPFVQLTIPAINYYEIMIFSIISWIWFLFIWIFQNLYELHKPVQKYFQTFSKVRLYWFIAITFISYFWRWFIFSYWISRFIIVITWWLSFLGIFLFDQIWNYLESQRHKKSWNKILIIWSDTMDSYIAIENIKKWFSFPSEFAKEDEIDDIDLSNYFIVVAAGTFPKSRLQAIFERIRFVNTRFYHIGEWFFLEDVVYAPENINSIIALEYKHSKLDWRSLVFKRALDVFFSTIFIIIFSPIMLIIAILIRLESKWPIIYQSKRVGQRGQLFTFLKFRSMYTHMSVWYWWKDAEDLYQKLINSDQNIREWVLPKIKNDPRITRIWRFIRKTSLDELPQLFCVLIGTMSLVWPRPHLQNEVNNYETRQKRLFSIKPWITGYAQVFGRDSLDFEQEAKLDLYYIQHRSIFLDIYILLATFGVVFKGK